MRHRRALEPVVVAGCRLGTGRPAEVAVRRGVVELEVEGLFGRRCLQLSDRVVGQRVGLVEAGQAVEWGIGAAEVVADAVFARLPAPRIPERAFDGAVVVERVAVEVVVGVGFQDRVPGVPPRRHRGPVVIGLVAVAVEGLADVDRAVAGGLQPGCDVVARRCAKGEARIAPVGLDVPLDAVVVRVAAGQHADPRRAAEGIGHVVAAEGHAAFGDQVDRVRHRPDGGLAEGRVEALEGLVVGLDHDEAGRLGFGRRRVRALPGRGEQAEQPEHACGEAQACSTRQPALCESIHKHLPAVDLPGRNNGARRSCETLEVAQDAPSFFTASRKVFTVALGALRPSSFSPWRLTQITGTFIFSSGATSLV